MSPNQCIFLGLILALAHSLKVVSAKPEDPADDTVERRLEEELLEGRTSLVTISGPPSTVPATTFLVDSLRQQAQDNKNALKRLAEVIYNFVYKKQKRQCMGTEGNLQQLTNSIKEGFTLLVGVAKELNNSITNLRGKITRKAMDQEVEETSTDDGPCPAPFFQAGEDCLYIETQYLLIFDAARQACLEMGARLAEFTNFNSFKEAVKGMDMHRDAAIYIGATDRHIEGRWRWLSGGTPSIDWADGEPNNSDDNENCVVYSFLRRKFNDVPCTYRREYVCQMK